MAKLRQSIKSFLLVVVFLVLTAIVAVIYGGNDGQRGKMESNILYQKTRLAIDTVWSAAQGLAGLNLNRNLGFGDNLADQIKQEVEKADVAEDGRAWSGLFDAIKREWQSGSQSEEIGSLDFNNLSGAGGLDSSDNLDSQENADLLGLSDSVELPRLSDLITLEETDAGRQLVFRSKSGKEYRVNLPFKKN
ncbi:MAG: hypothetical protein WC905_02385 [Patescibacteria group bacterium]|jgi:hypothetical protein